MKRIAVVGAGLAAVSTCAALRAEGYDGRLTLYAAESGLPYDRPPLSKDVLLGKADRTDVLLRPASWYEAQRVDLREATPVRAVRPGEGALELADGTREFADRVVLATGGTPRTLPGARVLRDWEDAERLRSRLLPGARVVVIGAGLIGAETAAAARALGCEVTIVDPVPVPLTAVVGDAVAGVLHARHSAEGIAVVTAGVDHVSDSAVVTADGRRIAADTVVAGIGIRPATQLASDAGLLVDNGIVVNAGQVTSHPHVYAVGDVARQNGHTIRHEHWEAAQRDGEAAAHGILGRPVPTAGAPWFWSDRHGSRLEAVGTMTDASRIVLRGTPASGTFTAFGVHAGRLVAAAAIDRGRDIKAARRIVDRGIEVDAGQLADEGCDLRTLLRG
ncbi:NAD(P)/FAD-dependent oxidoreductase [Streptomyces acidiscabies]|uniref:NAD(P)/FAD-dependent oxidoreductase n=1 Tax=Streptomyces acidiscabies TaxID=42234 RepID=UPI00073F5856|nr:FAD-dependent oxidoreductase [Streptomyces acidiscabies]GAQ57406.1 anthranilate 1,2-dioxygenase system [Streptomyces acidiscabies]